MTRDRVQGKTVLVTGAAGGIGSALSRQLAGRGANLVLLDVRGDELERVAEPFGDRCLWRRADITRLDEIESVVAEAIERFGSIDVVVANAGIVSVEPIERADPSTFERVINVNLLGSWRTVRATLPHLVRARGYTIFISSLAAEVQGPLHASYCASKAGLQTFAQTMRVEVGGSGIDVGVAHLTYTSTDTARAAVEPCLRLPGFRPMKPLSVERTADAIVRGIERRSRDVYVSVTGRVMRIGAPGFRRLVEVLARRKRWSEAIAELSWPADTTAGNGVP